MLLGGVYLIWSNFQRCPSIKINTKNTVKIIYTTCNIHTYFYFYYVFEGDLRNAVCWCAKRRGRCIKVKVWACCVCRSYLINSFWVYSCILIFIYFYFGKKFIVHLYIVHLTRERWRQSRSSTGVHIVFFTSSLQRWSVPLHQQAMPAWSDYHPILVQKRADSGTNENQFSQQRRKLLKKSNYDRIRNVE